MGFSVGRDFSLTGIRNGNRALLSRRKGCSMTGSSGSSFSTYSSNDTSRDMLVIDTQPASLKEDIIDNINVGDEMDVVVSVVNNLSTVQALWQRRWGYWFYPAHLAAMQAVRALL
jgi:hypothetical protein